MATLQGSRQEHFTAVTDLPGMGATSEALDMLRTRYQTAAEIAKGKDVAEIGCGPGMGLGWLQKVARSIVAGDYDEDMVARVARQYSGRVPVERVDAMQMPFEEGRFDAIFILEALYFIPDPIAAIREAKRVLRSGGVLMIAQPNPAYRSFNPAPHTFRYFTVDELREVLRQSGFSARVEAGFPEETGGLKNKALNLIRKAAVVMRLIPDTQEGKEKLKRMIYGKLPPFPEEVDDTIGTFRAFVPAESVEDLSDYKVLYGFGVASSDEKPVIGPS